ncbi:probable glycosyltransferase At5g03795 [Andrographis paniculata]|uniref:probable glycosyltransferase At5g03795 n=1 Tax=Andrographis paniculata TaxID=175694 RepID=UPI0021E7586F|nr:probable glycosyltransferase At5g03795 [Andrographis paniculata]
MGIGIRYACLVETRRLLLVMGVVFGLILLVQYFELPYSKIFSVLFLPDKSPSGAGDTFAGITFTNPHGTDEAPIAVYVFHHNQTVNDTVIDDIDPEDDPVERRTFPSSVAAMNSSPAKVSTDLGNAGNAAPENNHSNAKVLNNELPEINKTPSGLPENDPVNAKRPSKMSPDNVVTISEMIDMLLKSRLSYRAEKPRWPSPADQELLNAGSSIESAPPVENDPQFDVTLYRNFSAFNRSYELMEKTLKVYIYAEGDRPIFHQPPLKGIYASEGWFMKQLKSSKQFVTKKPRKAHLFYIPISSRALEVSLYVPDSHDRKPLISAVSNYVDMIRRKYTFWNRTDGSDHFLVACHDWAPSETRETMPNCIRSLCNSDIREGFRFGKDASLPETFVRTPQNPLRQLGGKPPSKRRILAFFAGNMHGYLRPILLSHWENKDPEMKIFGRMGKAKGRMSYAEYMKSSKFCICAKGFEVNSPRVVEAIFYECVPVIVSDNFVPPFFETLDWESFAVFVAEKDVPELKNILTSIPPSKYLKMQRRVRRVQQHFLWHSRPVKYDVFHMILHSVWHNRVFQIRPR